MIKGIGIDSVEIERFINWPKRPVKELQKIFSEKEITYCLANKQKAAERFAARFAAKEALFKALSQIIPHNNIPFLTVCKYAYISKECNGNPFLNIDWQALSREKKKKNSYKSFVSLTHTKNIATAIVIVENS